MITQSTKLNLIPGDVPKRITASQYDAGSRTLSFTLYNGAVAFTTAGVTAQIRGTKPDKKGFEYTATYNAGVVTADVTEQMTACAGEVICELQLSKDGQILGTANFILDVERAALGEDTDISETELPDIIDGARTQAANAAESAEDAAESAAIAEQAASGVYLGINMGKVVTVTSGVADTDIDLERMPKPGERILLVFEEERTSVTNIKTYLDGAGITIPIGTGEPSQKYLGQYVFECASGTQPESKLWNMVTKDYGGLPTPFATSVGGTGNTSGYIRTGREGSSTVGTAATIEGTHNEAGYANQTVMGTYNSNKADTLLEVGNGTGNSARSNALEVKSNGDVIAGNDVINADGYSLRAAENAISNLKTATGTPVIVEDALESNADGLVAQIVPIQDLHGYDKPWSGGSGKNKLPMTVEGIKALNTSGTWNGNAYTKNGVTYTLITDDGNNISEIIVTGTASANSSCDLGVCGLTDSVIMNGCPAGGSRETYCLATARGLADVYDTGSGTNAFTSTATMIAYIAIYSGYSCPTGGLRFRPMIRLASVSDATFAPYSNICPISGRTEVNLDTEGRNIWDEEWELGDINGNTGQDLVSSDYIRSSYIKVSLASLYMRTPTTIRKWIYFYDKNKQYLGDSVRIRGNTNETFSLPTNAGYIRFLVAVSEYGSSTYRNNICINVSDPDFNGQYVPYKGSVTLTIALGQTVYGGTLDVKTGVGTITHALVDMGSLTWTRHGTYTDMFVSADLTDKALGNFNLISSVYKTSEAESLAGMQNLEIKGNTTYVNVYVKDDNYTDAETFKAAVTGQKICYELATPTTLQLTPALLALLMGYNRITSDSGELTLTYKANAVQDLQTDKADNADMVDYIENGNKASRAYSANQFMLWKGDLYKVTTSIASGATITAGTNVTKTTIGAVLTALLNA